MLRQLIETYGFDRSIIRTGYRPTARGRRSASVDIAIFQHGQEPSDDSVERVIFCQTQKPREKLRSPREAAADLRRLKEKLELLPSCHMGMWTNGHTRRASGGAGANRAVGGRFNKLVVFDEAHKYIDSPDLVAGPVEVVREMRHKGTSIMVASQDPPSVPTALIELSTQIVLHRSNSPAWLKHIQKANAAFHGLSPGKLSSLGSGEACVWSSKATDDAFVS